MPVTSLTRIPVWVWIPPTCSPLYKIEITRNDGITLDDITDYTTNASFVDGATEIIGTFSIKASNGNESYTGIWSGNETVKLYCDYDTSATTMRFRGIVEKVAYGNNQIILTGRSDALLIFGRTVTQSYNNQEISIVLKDLIDKYGDGKFTYTNVATTAISKSFSWRQKAFWDCVKELCNASGYDCYIDVNRDFNFFLIGSRLNTTDAIVHDYNLVDAPADFGTDKGEIRNKVIVYGAEIGGLTNVWTAEDTSLQNTMNRIQETIITDSNLKTQADVQDRANQELSVLKQEKQLGSRTSIGLATIQPGQQLRLSDPYNNIPPGNYPVIQYTHTIDLSAAHIFTTQIQLNRLPISLTRVMKSRIDDIQSLGNITNQYEMQFSFNVLFDSQTESLNNTFIADGVLKSGSSYGTWTSINHSANSDITSCELKVVGSTLESVSYEISNDGGFTWNPIIKDTNFTFNTTGSLLKIRVTISSTTSEVSGLVILYK